MSDTTKKSIVINKSFLSGTDNSGSSNSNNKKSKKNTRNLSEEIIKPNKLKKMLLDKINAKRKAEQGSYMGGRGGIGSGGATGAGDNIENKASKLDISKETKIFSSEFKKSLDFLDNYIGQKRNEKMKSKTLKRQNNNSGPSTSLNNDILKYVNSNNRPSPSNVISPTNNTVKPIQTPSVIQANHLSPQITQRAVPVSATPVATPVAIHSPHSPPLFQKIQLNLPSKPMQTTPPNLLVGSGPKINLSLGKTGNENMMVYTELPPELQNFTPPVYNTQSILSMQQPSVSSPMPATSIHELPSMGGDVIMRIDKTGGATGAGENEKIVELINNENIVNIGKTSLSESTPTFSPVKLTDDAPYGCLKNGKKPTFRMYNKTIKTNHHHNHRDHDDHDNENTIYTDRQSKLRDLQNKHNKHKYPGLKTNGDNICDQETKSELESDKDANTEEKRGDVKKTKIRRHLRKTITKKFKLGKQPGSNVVGVLIKNNDTRKNIQKECGLLKSKQLSEVKKYLVEKNLIKIGSTAPPGVIRNIYEASMLAGEVDNIGKGVILHNFLEDKKMW
jgi:hypothetical protein